MQWYIVFAGLYALVGFFVGLYYAHNIVSTLSRIRHPEGPPSDKIMVVGSALGVFLLMGILWMPLKILDNVYYSKASAALNVPSFRLTPYLVDRIIRRVRS